MYIYMSFAPNNIYNNNVPVNISPVPFLHILLRKMSLDNIKYQFNWIIGTFISIY